MSSKPTRFTRRDLLKLGAATGAASIFTRSRAQTCIDQTPVPIDTLEFTGCGVGGEVFPASPFIVSPFVDPLPVPKALAPGWRRPDGTLDPLAGDAWTVRQSAFGRDMVVRPGPEPGHQDAMGERQVYNADLGLPPAGTHQLYPGRPTPNLTGQALAVFNALPEPILYHIRLQVRQHAFTSSPVRPIAKDGTPVTLPFGASAFPAGTDAAGNALYKLPQSTIYGFNGTFPGPMINFEYHHPCIVRFENDLDLNPLCLDRQDFGAPDWAFLTHQHNGHTAPESDGQPHHLQDNEGGYQPMQWSDNLYLGYPAGGLDVEKQSFLWFHDHRMHHTGPNVYKGMVGLMPHYDPKIDSGDESTGLRLPGVRTNNPDGSFDVKYDIPLALYDCILDDGVTQHFDNHTLPDACGDIHPEWWGQLFLRHYPNHGFVGDVFTVNCTAFPVLTVDRRKYRFRFLGASLSRCYELSLRKGTPVPVPGHQGQWNFGRVARNGKVTIETGTQVMRMTQIASEGGLLPVPILRDSIEIWPAKRREVIVDFTRYQDGTPTVKGDVVYFTNTMQMLDGRKPVLPGDPGANAKIAVPLLKFIIGDLAPDDSVMPVAGVTPLRPAPFFPNPATALTARDFTLMRGGSAGGETEWLINNLQFDPLFALAQPRRDSFEVWGINNGGGGWTHPMHIHMEEHHVLSRTSKRPHPEDTGKEDVVALDPSERTVIFRWFRTFLGNYVAHCHNLAHEDHNMMFGWTIVP